MRGLAAAVITFRLACISVVAGCTHHQSLGDGRALMGASLHVETDSGCVESGEVLPKPEPERRADPECLEQRSAQLKRAQEIVDRNQRTKALLAVPVCERVPVQQRGGFAVFIRTERGDFELDEVLKITEIRRLRGALEGFGLGVLVGGGSGALLGYSGGDTPHGFAKSAGENALVGGVMAGALGGIVGLVVGTVRGSRDVYRVTGAPRSQTRFIPAAPPGSAVGATVRF